ncbi:MAG: redoxin domain-containing protein [Bacteroides sp.]|nr:redoxin domain-containing protein [Bacteroides sp.]
MAGILTFLICTPLRAFSIGGYPAIYHSGIIGFVIYSLVTYFVCRKYSGKVSPHIVLCTIIMAVIIIQLPGRIFDFKSSLFTLPEQILHIIGVWVGYAHYRHCINKWWSITIGVAAYIILIILLIPPFYHYLWFGTANGHISPKRLSDFSIINKEKDTIKLHSMESSYILFEIWYTGCGSCYKSFPVLDDFYQKYKDSKEFAIYSLNIPFKQNKEDPFTLIEEYQTSPLQLSQDDKDMFIKETGLQVYPTTIVLNKKRQIIFRGDLKRGMKYLQDIISDP